MTADGPDTSINARWAHHSDRILEMSLKEVLKCLVRQLSDALGIGFQDWLAVDASSAAADTAIAGCCVLADDPCAANFTARRQHPRAWLTPPTIRRRAAWEIEVNRRRAHYGVQSSHRPRCTSLAPGVFHRHREESAEMRPARFRFNDMLPNHRAGDPTLIVVNSRLARRTVTAASSTPTT